MPRGGERTKDKDDMGYTGEKIKLGGKMRRLKYPISGLKMLARHFGTVVDGLSAFKGFNTSFDEAGLDKLVKMTHAGLIHEDKELTLEDVENMIGPNAVIELPTKLMRALDESQPPAKESSGEGNPT
jgi:hypothetical protein